ncbi:MAG: bifunctional folylpolyglutamate synthase/dihydrofolate synthase [Cyclobacteriaceae bacterium]|nr:bifunctional folylpolyglutamate synthase/dihydrofolate synthase [Cyclobacteriaceae bacterium]
MTYPQTLDYLYQSLPMFQRVGAVAYKKDLTNTLALCQVLDNPHQKFKTIHVAGTNGKGSSSHMLAAILQSAGYKTGLYTSPHLKSFTERIKVNGADVSQTFVTDFVARVKPALERIKPSFFETTVAMAFDYFAAQRVDVAVIEVGLGGRLDSTNVITPVLSLITNISLDHQDLLGDTLPQIALEKAGIIKPHVPVVVSQRQAEVQAVFSTRATQQHAELVFASDHYELEPAGQGYRVKQEGVEVIDPLVPDLKGNYQQKNIPGVLASCQVLRQQGFAVSWHHIKTGIENTQSLTGLKGRWQTLRNHPRVICDTAHNEDGIRQVVEQLVKTPHQNLWMVIGMVKDKDISSVLALLPVNAHYFFCQAHIPRALDAHALANQARAYGLRGRVVADVNTAVQEATQMAAAGDLIFVGGSTFVVAELAGL